MFALDTNSVLYIFKNHGRVAERLLETPHAEVAIPAVVLYELEVGLAKSASPQSGASNSRGFSTPSQSSPSVSRRPSPQP